ncbi:uncharacterized protein [Antedon mediterranea]|uniref:uncharacterized protein n=1 Tax=Antedon mediterranea TaxID=105859 RepID=UPI003AF577DB
MEEVALENKMSGQEKFRCQDHPDNIMERYCTTCTKSACKDCEHFMTCYTAKHDTKPMKVAVDEFNKNVTETITSAKDIKQELEAIFNSIICNDGELKSQVDYINKLIENHIAAVVKKVKEEGEKLMKDLQIVCKQKKDAIKSQVKELEPHQMQLQSLKKAVEEMTDKPENKNTLNSYKSDIEGIQKNIDKMKETFLSYANNLTPNFTINTELYGAISKGLGKITSVDNRFSITEDDEFITVIKGQISTVVVKNVVKCDAGVLTATLVKPSGENIAIEEVEHIGNGTYRIKSKCNEEGDWKMEITTGVASIKGSPVNITVLPTLVHTVSNIGSLQIDSKVTDVKLNKDGCMLVSSRSNELLKFSQSGSFISTVHIPNIHVYKMHQMENGYFMFSDAERKNVVLCNDRFKVITQFGKGILKCPVGLAVNNETKCLYVADREAHCVYQFNIDDGKLIGKIGLISPHDVTLTKEGNLLIPDWSTNKIKMFSANGMFMKTIVDGGEQDDKVWNPICIVIDRDENIIVASIHKLQLFDKNGIFIKRIDAINDNIDIPSGIAVISNNPRRVAVANCGENNVKIFNY